MGIFTIDKKERMLFIAILVASFFYVLPIILSGQFYIDDLRRSIWGDLGWSQIGRPLSDLILKVITLGGLAGDTFPLTLILSVLLISFSVFKYVKSIRIITDTKVIFMLTVSVMCSPFMIENMSFRYDSVTMAASLSFIILAFTIKSTDIKALAIGALLVIFSLCTYQATIGVFFTLSILEFCIKTKSSQRSFDNILTLIKRVAQFLTSFIIYTKLISPYFVVGFYGENHSELLPLTAESITAAIKNTASFASMIVELNYIYGYILIASVVLSMLSSLMIARGAIKNEVSLYSIASAVIVIASPFFAVLFSFIHLVPLKNPVILPRTMMSFCATIMFFGISISMLSGRSAKALLALFILCSLSYVYTYGNASKSQSESDGRIVETLRYAVGIKGIDAKNLIIYGESPKTKQSIIAENKYPSIKRLIQMYLSGNRMWSRFLMMHHGMGVTLIDNSSLKLSRVCAWDTIYKDESYLIKNEKTTVAVIFGDKCK